MTSRSYYDILEVDRKAEFVEIKASYRRLARLYHPDQNPGDQAAEERFKALVEAYEVLSRPETRAAYDRFGYLPSGAAYGAPVALRRQSVVVGIVRTMADAAKRRLQAERGADLTLDIELDFIAAAAGTRRILELPRAVDDDGLRVEPRRLEFSIPPDIKDGQHLRWRGEGAPGRFGGAAGDLVLRCKVRPDAFFRREGLDVHAIVPVNVVTLVHGGTIEVPTVHGPTRLHVPAGTRPGQRMRLSGLGAIGRTGRRGDAIYEVTLALPAADAIKREALEAIDATLSEPVPDMERHYRDALRRSREC